MPAFGAPCADADKLTRVTGGQECLIARTYRKSDGSAPVTLYVLLHGNHTSGSPATSQFKEAESLAGKTPQGTVAVALIRPGRLGRVWTSISSPPGFSTSPSTDRRSHDGSRLALACCPR